MVDVAYWIRIHDCIREMNWCTPTPTCTMMFMHELNSDSFQYASVLESTRLDNSCLARAHAKHISKEDSPVLLWLAGSVVPANGGYHTCHLPRID